MDTQRILLGLLAFAVIAATARLLWFALRGTSGTRPRAWRVALLALLQLASAALLYRTLLPPPVATGIDALATFSRIQRLQRHRLHFGPPCWAA